MSTWKQCKALPRVFREALHEWMNDNVPRLGASLAFYTLLSLAPVVVIIVAVAGLAFGQKAAQGQLWWQIRDLVGSDRAGTIQEIIKGAYKPRAGVLATLLGLLTLGFGASSVFIELHDALNTIWHVPLRRRTNAAIVIRLVKDRFLSFAMVLGAGFLLLVSLALNAWITAVGIFFPQIATFVMSVLVIAVLFAALYKIVPDVRLKWSDVALGAAVTSLLFTAGRQVTGLYFAKTNFGSTYGAAGSLLVVLLWVYYSAQLFFWALNSLRCIRRSWGLSS